MVTLKDKTQFPVEPMRPHSRQVLVHVPKMPNGEFVKKAMQHPVSRTKVWDSFELNDKKIDETFQNYSRIIVLFSLILDPSQTLRNRLGNWLANRLHNTLPNRLANVCTDQVTR